VVFLCLEGVGADGLPVQLLLVLYLLHTRDGSIQFALGEYIILPPCIPFRNGFRSGSLGTLVSAVGPPVGVLPILGG